MKLPSASKSCWNIANIVSYLTFTIAYHFPLFISPSWVITNTSHFFKSPDWTGLIQVRYRLIFLVLLWRLKMWQLHLWKGTWFPSVVEALNFIQIYCSLVSWSWHNLHIWCENIQKWDNSVLLVFAISNYVD